MSLDKYQVVFVEELKMVLHILKLIKKEGHLLDGE